MLLYMLLQIILDYFLMLIVMTCNAWLFITIILNAGTRYLYALQGLEYLTKFRQLIIVPVLTDDCVV